MGCRSFILKVVEYTWVQYLRDPYSFYTRVAPRDLLNPISTHSGGLKRADVVAMFSIMQYPHVPKFINIFDAAQKKATCAYLPITNDWLDAMATSALIFENYFTNDRPAWDGLVLSAHTWTALKLKFTPLHSAMKR